MFYMHTLINYFIIATFLMSSGAFLMPSVHCHYMSVIFEGKQYHDFFALFMVKLNLQHNKKVKLRAS